MAQSADSTSHHRADTVKRDFRPTGIRIGTDVISLIKSRYVPSFTGWEVNADVDFYRYYLAIDYGSWGRNYVQKNDSGSYNNSGNYYRIGVDVNFLTKDPEKNMFFIGFRYGHSVFSETYNAILYDPIWQPSSTASQNFTNSNVKAHWLELTTGLRVRIWKVVWMGYTARFKFGLKTSNTPTLLPSDVPGFGRTDKIDTWGFNYQIFVRLPLPKKK